MILANENALKLCPFFILKNEVVFIEEIKCKFKSVLSVLDLNYIKNIEDYTITRKDGVKLNILKVEPVNFNLKTKAEQKNILESYKFLLKQCNFDFQIYIQTQKINVEKHIDEIQKCVEFESEIADMAIDYMNLIKELSESKNNISRRFYFVYEVKGSDSRNLAIQEGLELCGNVVTMCDKKEILKLFNGCLKTTIQRSCT